MQPNRGGVGAAEPGVLDTRGRKQWPRAKPGRQRWLDISRIDRQDNVRLAGEAPIEKMDQALGEFDPSADVGAANPDESAAVFLHHLLFDDPGEMRIAPIVHVLVCRPPYHAPVDWRIAQQHAK